MLSFMFIIIFILSSIVFTYVFLYPPFEFTSCTFRNRPEGQLLRRAGGELEVHHPAPNHGSPIFSRGPAWPSGVAQAIEPVGGLFRAHHGLRPKRIFEACGTSLAIWLLRHVCVMSASYRIVSWCQLPVVTYYFVDHTWSFSVNIRHLLAHFMVFMELSPLWYTVFILLFVWKALKKLQAHQIILGALDLLLQVVQILEFPKLQAAHGGRGINGGSSTWITMTSNDGVGQGGTLKEVRKNVPCQVHDFSTASRG